MVRNLKISLIAQLGICLIIIFIQSNPMNLYSQAITGIISLVLYILVGLNLTSLGSRITNLLSVCTISFICILLTGICCTIYQFIVIYKYDYKFEPFYYTILKIACFMFNAPVLPFARLFAYFNNSFQLPYGLLVSFFIPSLMLWLGLEFKNRKAVKIKG